MSQFAFLHREWPEVFGAARRAEHFAYGDPRTSCFYGACAGRRRRREPAVGADLLPIALFDPEKRRFQYRM